MRNKKLTPQQHHMIVTMHLYGFSIYEIAAKFNRNKSTIYAYLNKYHLPNFKN